MKIIFKQGLESFDSDLIRRSWVLVLSERLKGTLDMEEERLKLLSILFWCRRSKAGLDSRSDLKVDILQQHFDML